jgi:hypothetical protein
MANNKISKRLKGDFIMRQKSEIATLLAGLIVVGITAVPTTMAQNAAPPSLLEQLQAQYKSVKMGSDSNGPTALEEGTVLAIQKGGILGVPSGSPKPCPSKYENASLKPPSGWCTQGRGEGGKHGFGILKNYIPYANMVPDSKTNTSDTRYFKVGEKVYPSNIAVDIKNERISFGIVACDTCNQTNPPTYYKSEVDFQFAKGYLETADVSKVEDTIGEVFAIDTSSPGTEAQQPGAPPEQPAAAQPATAQAAPASIQLGQTIDQVVNAFGQPEKIVDLGSKKIYAFKDLKVTFVNGKVTDVQ